MKYAQVGICIFDENGNILTKKILEDKWNLDSGNLQEIDQILEKHHNTHVEDQITSIMLDKISQNLTSKEVTDWLSDTLKNMMK